jgi:hypothetical protein
MIGWKPSALIGPVMTFPSLIFFALYALKIGPSFRQLFADFGGGGLPLISRIAVEPMLPVAVIGFLICGIVGGAMRPKERFVVLPFVAAAGFVLAIATMVAAYLPILSLASSIR